MKETTMLARRNLIGFVVGLSACAAFFAACSKPGPAGPNNLLKQLSVPSKVFSIYGEVMAFEATAEAGQKRDVVVSLKPLQSRIGGFQRVFVYEYNREGKVLSRSEAKVSADTSVTLPVAGGNRYLIYADMGARFGSSYEIACRIRDVPISREVLPRICTQIFCVGDVFRAAMLTERVPELKRQAGMPDLGNELIGGFGSSGPICDQCWQRTEAGGGFIPAKGCDGNVPPDPVPSASNDLIVYDHTPFPFDAPSGNSQIFKMGALGNNPVNLSNNAHFEWSPDVHHQTKEIVFETTRANALHRMDINGGNVTEIPDTLGAGSPKWGRGPRPFIVFTYPAWGANSAIYRINPDGSDRVQITSPSTTESDGSADVVNDKFIIFTRTDRANNFNRDIFLKYVWDDRAAVRLTNTTDRSETLGVVSHNGQMIAFRVFIGAGDEEIHVASLNTGTGTIAVLHTIRLSLPATYNISGIDFSTDDTRLYVSVQVNDVPGNLINRMQELFSIRLDGGGQHRLTLNSDADEYPSAVSP